MTLDEFRVQMNAWWDQTDAREVARKNSQGALLELVALYEGLSTEERVLADQVLVEWIGCGNERKRFDALAMVDRFRIRSAIAHLRSLASKIEKQGGHEAPYELAKIKRIIVRLGE